MDGLTFWSAVIVAAIPAGIAYITARRANRHAEDVGLRSVAVDEFRAVTDAMHAMLTQAQTELAQAQTERAITQAEVDNLRVRVRELEGAP